MDAERAEEFRKTHMLDHDAAPNMLTDAVESMRTFGTVAGDTSEILEGYRAASAVVVDFFDRVVGLAIHEASSGGNLVNFDGQTHSQILLQAVREFPDYLGAYNGTNTLLAEAYATIEEQRKQMLELSGEFSKFVAAYTLPANENDQHPRSDINPE